MSKEAKSLIQFFLDHGLSLALAESVTCGLAAHQLSTCKGTADVLKGAIVCYTPEVKNKLLKIPKSTIDSYTCESREVTRLLSLHLSKVIKADVHAAITGLASAGGSETKTKPVGTIFFSMSYKGKTFQKRIVFKGSPLQIRKQAVKALYMFILSKLT